MQWISVVTAVGITALVNFCAAEEVDVCNGGKASARNINLTIDLTSLNYRCCCHLSLKRTQVLWRNMTVGCGITLVHDVSFLGKTCKSRGTISQKVSPGEIAFDLCVVREDCQTQTQTQTQSLQGQLMLAATIDDIDVNCRQPDPCPGSSERGVTKVEPTTELTSTSSDIDVNCSDPLSMIPSTGSTQPGVTEVESTTELTPSTSSEASRKKPHAHACTRRYKSAIILNVKLNFITPPHILWDEKGGVYITLAVIGGVLTCIGVVCVILVNRRNQNFSLPQETVCDVQVKRYNEDIILHVDMAENQKETNVPAECACEDNGQRSVQVINGHFDDVDNTVKNQENIISESQLTASCNTLKQYIQGNGVGGDYYEDVDNTTTNQKQIPESQSTASCNSLEQNSQDKGVGADYEDVDNTAKSQEDNSESQSTASCNTLEQHRQGNGVSGDYEDIDNKATNHGDISESHPTASCSTQEHYSQGKGVCGDYEDIDNTAKSQEDIPESQSTASSNTLKQNSQADGVGGGYEDIDDTEKNQEDISESQLTASCNPLKLNINLNGADGGYEDIDNTAKNQECACISASQSTASCNSLKQHSQSNVVGGDYEDMDNTADPNEQPTGPDKVEFDTCIKDIIQDIAYEIMSTGEGNHRPASVLQICHETILKTGDVYAKVKK